MKYRLPKMKSLIFMLIIMSCINHYAMSESKMRSDIKSGTVQKYDDNDSFIIKFTNLIFEKNGKEMKIPVFQGNTGDVYYNDFHEYCYSNNLLERGYAESSFVIKTDKGKITKTFREFLNFYKGNILKNVNINKPSKFVVFDDGKNLRLYYDFEVNEIPFMLQIDIRSAIIINDPDTIKSILDIGFDENVTPSIFRFNFWKNKKSKDL